MFETFKTGSRILNDMLKIAARYCSSEPDHLSGL